MIKNKKREQITSLTFRRHRQTPNNLKRVKAHAVRREPSTLLLVVSLIWRISETRIKADASQYVCYIYFAMLPYAVRFRVLHYSGCLLNKSSIAFLSLGRSSLIVDTITTSSTLPYS